MMNQAISLVLIALLLSFVTPGSKEEWKSRSIYQLLTDRFARNDGQQAGCGDLGILMLS